MNDIQQQKRELEVFLNKLKLQYDVVQQNQAVAIEPEDVVGQDSSDVVVKSILRPQISPRKLNKGFISHNQRSLTSQQPESQQEQPPSSKRPFSGHYSDLNETTNYVGHSSSRIGQRKLPSTQIDERWWEEKAGQATLEEKEVQSEQQQQNSEYVNELLFCTNNV